MALELTPEQKQKIDEAFKHLPEGFEIVSTEQITILKEQKNRLQSVFVKLKPIFAGFTGGGDIMSALPQIMPVIAQLQTDKELTDNLATIIESIK